MAGRVTAGDLMPYLFTVEGAGVGSVRLYNVRFYLSAVQQTTSTDWVVLGKL